jgi:hypothetical protein
LPRPPEDSPEFFVDRSLGQQQLPDAIQRVGYVVHTLVSVYGQRAGERIADEHWLERCGTEGWVVLTKDDAIRRRPLERQALERHGVRAFILTTASLTGPQQVDRIMTNLNRIIQRSRKPGPSICAIYQRRVVQIWPVDSR